MPYIIAAVLSLIAFASSYFLGKKKIETEKEALIKTQSEEIEKLKDELWNLQGKVLDNMEKIEEIQQSIYVPKSKAEKVIEKVMESKTIANKFSSSFSKDK